MCAMKASRPCAGRRRKIEYNFSEGCPWRRLPVLDMIETSERTGSGWRDRERLGDHAAHRGADHVRGREVQLGAAGPTASSAM